MQTTLVANLLFEACIINNDVYNFYQLLENRLDFIKQSHPNLASVVDSLAEKQDPTPNKKYTEWLLNRHLKGDDVWQPSVREGLSYFSKASSSAHDTNIKNHTVESMLDVAHLVKTSPVNARTHEAKLEKLYSSDGVEGFKIPDKHTSTMIYGHGQKYSSHWCTAANSSNNMFDRYEGGKYTMHFPNGSFLQMNHSSGQLKDPSNSEISVHTDSRYTPYNHHIEKFMRQTADLEGTDQSLANRHYGLTGKDFEDAWRNHKSSRDALTSFASAVDKVPLTHEQFHDALAVNLQNRVATNPYLTHDQIGWIVHNRYTPRILENSSLRGDHITHVIKHVLSPEQDHDKITQLGRLQNLEPHHVDLMLDEADHANTSDRARHIYDGLHAIADTGIYKFNHGQLDRIAAHPSGVYLSKVVGSHQPLPHHLVQPALDDYKFSLKHGFDTSSLPKFSKHNEISSDNIDHIISIATSRPHSPRDVSHLYSIHGISNEQKERLTNSLTGKQIADEKFVSNPDVPHSHIVHLLHSDKTLYVGGLAAYGARRDSKAKVMREIADTNGITAEDLNLMDYHTKSDMPREDFKSVEHAPFIAMNLQHHPKATKEDLHNLIDSLHGWSEAHKAIISQKMTNSIMSHPNVNVDHMKKIMNHWGNDWMVHEVIRDHARTPPSIVQQSNNNFWQPE